MIKHFYLYSSVNDALLPVSLHHDYCLELSCQCQQMTLAKDIEEWRDKAAPGDAFIVDTEKAIWCLDLQISVGRRVTSGPYSPAEVVHGCPADGSALLSCCKIPQDELPAGHHISNNPKLVTCGNDKKLELKDPVIALDRFNKSIAVFEEDFKMVRPYQDYISEGVAIREARDWIKKHTDKEPRFIYPGVRSVTYSARRAVRKTPIKRS